MRDFLLLIKQFKRALIPIVKRIVSPPTLPITRPSTSLRLSLVSQAASLLFPGRDMKGKTLLQKLHILRPPKRTDVDWDHSLPIETLEVILSYLVDERDKCLTRVAYTRETLQPTLRAAALVCRVWYDVATSHLYNEIHLSSSKALERLFDALRKYKHLPPLVHQFYFSSKVFASGNPQLIYTIADEYNFKRIITLCPNLFAFIQANPLKRLPLTGDDLAFRTLKFERTYAELLTYLELSVPNDALFGGIIVFPASLEFTALQTLHIGCSWRSCHDESEFNSPQWFRVPQLRRLTLRSYNVGRRQRLTFPDSPLLHTIDLVGGDYRMVDNLFDPETSPLLPFRKTLQSLTITGSALGEVKLPMPGRMRWVIDLIDLPFPTPTPWSLDFLESLVELCLPFRSFAERGVAKYPPRLKEFALVGNHLNIYTEALEEMSAGSFKLSRLFFGMQVGEAPQELRRVHVLLRNVDAREFMTSTDSACYAGVDLILGFSLYELKSFGSDLIGIGLKKAHLKR